MDVLDEQEFHELCMDYRAALVWGPKTPQECFVELQAFIRREVRREALEEAAKLCERSATDAVAEADHQEAIYLAEAIRALYRTISPPEQ